MKNYDAIIKELNMLQLQTCEKIKCGDLLYYRLKQTSDDNRFSFCLKGLKHLFISLFFIDANISVSGDNPSSLIVFSPEYKLREDYINNYQKVIGLLDDYVLIWPRKKRRIKLPNLKSLLLVRKWNSKLKESIDSFGLRQYCIASIFEASRLYASFSSFIMNRGYRIDRLLTLCDVHLVDCYFTQSFNSVGKTTVTLQHGTFTSKVNPWAIEGSKSTFFLANSKFTFDEGLFLNYKNRMIIVGLYSMIGSSSVRNKESHEVKTIGAFLDGGGEESKEDNVRFIQMLISYCKSYGTRVLLKFHPTTDINAYSYLFSDLSFVSVVNKKTTVSSFCQQIDVSICRNSTTLLESLHYYTPSYIFNEPQQRYDLYENTMMLKFATIKELHALIGKGKIESIKSDLKIAREYFAVSGDIKTNYSNALKEIGFATRM